MKKICSMLCMLGLSSMLSAQDPGTTILNDEVLNGRVKCLINRNYGHLIRMDSIPPTPNLEMVYKFNEYGERTDRIALDEHVVSVYNDKQQAESSTTYIDGRVCAYGTCDYDEVGNLIKSTIRFPKSDDKVIHYYDYFTTLHSYDKNRNRIDEKKISKRRGSKKEQLDKHMKYQYDSLGNCVVEEYLSNGELIERKENKYVDNLLAETFMWQWFEGEDLYIRYLYGYNADKTLKLYTEIIYHYGSDEEIATIHRKQYGYKYDSEDRLIEKSVFEHGDMDFSDWYKNATIKYGDFDAYNNWTRRETYTEIYREAKKENYQVLATREIEYYDE